MGHKISVVIPAFNAAQTIEKAIASVRNQTMRDSEIVVVDDCSTDGTYDVVKALAANDAGIKLLRLPENSGSAVARNLAIDNASGEWIAMLDADDWIEPPRFEVMLKAAEEYQADVVYDNMRIYDHVVGEIVDRTGHGRKNQVTPLSAKMFIDHDNMLRRYAMGYMQPVFKSDFVRTHHIRYDPSHRAAQDFIFQVEMLLNGAKNIIVPGAYYVYVHWISPTTRKKSPFSRSKPGRSHMIVRGCDELLAKYARSMTEAERTALLRRRGIFVSRIECDRMMEALRQRRLVEAVKILAARPFILVLNAVTIMNMIRANGLRLWRAASKFAGRA